MHQKQIMIAPHWCFSYDEEVNIDDIFSRSEPVRGIIAIKNLKTGKTFLKKTEDAVKSFRDERFALDLSMHESRELQNDYTTTGLELFTRELEKEASPEDDLEKLLIELKENCKAKGISLYS